MSHSIREYFLDLLNRESIKDPKIRKMADDKIMELMPELQRHIVTEEKDSYGNVYYCNGENAIALKEIAMPLDDSLKDVIANAIEAVVISDDNSNKERADFVYSLMKNAGDIVVLINYFKENGKDSISEWLDKICPMSLSVSEISEIMDACNYTKFDC